jgi:hypothetical protein
VTAALSGSFKAMLSPLEIVEAQFEAYNAQDVDRFCSFYAADCVVTDLKGKVILEGREAFRQRFAKTFADYPENRAWSEHRFTLGNLVVDHEVGERVPGGERFELIAIYTIWDGLIARLAMGKGD